MGSFSIWHWLIVLVIILLIFGTKKLRNVGQDLGGALHLGLELLRLLGLNAPAFDHRNLQVATDGRERRSEADGALTLSQKAIEPVEHGQGQSAQNKAEWPLPAARGSR